MNIGNEHILVRPTTRILGYEALIVSVTGNVLAKDGSHFVKHRINEVLSKLVKFAKLEQIWIP